MTKRERRHLHATIRGLLLKKWGKETDLIGEVFACLCPTDSLFRAISELNQEWKFVLSLPENDEGVREWNQRREAVLEAARRRIN